MAEKPPLYLGFDIGGTKCSVCIGHPDGTIVGARRVPTSSLGGAHTAIPRLTDLANGLLQDHSLRPVDLQAIGISAPGPVDVKNGRFLKPPNMPGWEYAPFVEHWETAFQRPAHMNNDANTCVLAEWYYGEFKGCDNLVYITNSTGYGAGIMCNGQLLQGVTDTAGEIGYLVLDAGCPFEYGGMHGSQEGYLGGMATAQRLQREIREQSIATSIVDHAHGNIENITFKHFVAAVNDGDDYATRQWNTYCERMAQGLGILLQVLNPEAIVLGTLAAARHAQAQK